MDIQDRGSVMADTAATVTVEETELVLRLADFVEHVLRRYGQSDPTPSEIADRCRVLDPEQV